ncbi:MAG TPA: CcmD family protein [bacterium]|nr:CcmD family protein [bacterium]
MTYLFWSFAVVWIGLCAYIRVLMRRTRMLEEELRRLAGEPSDAPRTASWMEDRPAPAGRDTPSPVSRAAP